VQLKLPYYTLLEVYAFLFDSFFSSSGETSTAKMVLFELGQKLESAMKKMQATHVVDEEVVSQLLQEIARALLEVCSS